jgi:2-(1,2-epoxy-1,2-dihydrophenyl)acetyl-CoA isomerase
MELRQGPVLILPLCCDIVVASKSASFLQAFSKIGLIPDSGGTYTLPRLIGWQKASALAMLGEAISATEAEEMGMIYKVFPDETFAENSKSIASVLATMPTRGLAYTKQLLNMSFTTNFEEQIHDEDIFQQKAAQTADFKEGVNAFLEKRKPLFKGE